MESLGDLSSDFSDEVVVVERFGSFHGAYDGGVDDVGSLLVHLGFGSLSLSLCLLL